MPSMKAEGNNTSQPGSKPPTPGQRIVTVLSECFDLAEHRRYLARDLRNEVTGEDGLLSELDVIDDHVAVYGEPD